MRPVPEPTAQRPRDRHHRGRQDNSAAGAGTPAPVQRAHACPGRLRIAGLRRSAPPARPPRCAPCPAGPRSAPAVSRAAGWRGPGSRACPGCSGPRPGPRRHPGRTARYGTSLRTKKWSRIANTSLALRNSCSGPSSKASSAPDRSVTSAPAPCPCHTK